MFSRDVIFYAVRASDTSNNGWPGWRVHVTKLPIYPQVPRRNGRHNEQKQQHTEARSCALQPNHTHEIGEVVSRWLLSIILQNFSSGKKLERRAPNASSKLGHTEFDLWEGKATIMDWGRAWYRAEEDDHSTHAAKRTPTIPPTQRLFLKSFRRGSTSSRLPRLEEVRGMLDLEKNHRELDGYRSDHWQQHHAACLLF